VIPATHFSIINNTIDRNDLTTSVSTWKKITVEKSEIQQLDHESNACFSTHKHDIEGSFFFLMELYENKNIMKLMIFINYEFESSVPKRVVNSFQFLFGK